MAKTNQQVAHIWAQGHKETAQGSNFRCVDNKLYSYNTLVGIIIDGTAFISADNMTPTTAKQLNYAKRATDYQYFASPAFEYGYSGGLSAREMIEAAALELIEAFKALLRARKPRVEEYQQRRQEIIDIAARFSVTIPEIPEAGDDLKEKAKAYQEAERERKKKRDQERKEAEEIARQADAHDFNIWLTTGAGRCPSSYQRTYAGGSQETDFLTIRGNMVITSRGAEAPLEHVRKAVRFYLSRKMGVCKTCARVTTYNKTASACCGAPMLQQFDINKPGTPFVFEPYHTNGHKIPLGHFTLDEIDEQGNVKAGCHRFTAAEVARFINQWREVLG
jgi:hypothetical protein